MLLALEKKLLAEVKSSATEGPVGAMTVMQIDRDHPSYGEVDGDPVTILGEGNRIGFSPVTLVRDEDGEEAWIPKRLVRNTDPRLAPIAFATPTRTAKARK